MIKDLELRVLSFWFAEQKSGVCEVCFRYSWDLAMFNEEKENVYIDIECMQCSNRKRYLFP